MRTELSWHLLKFAVLSQSIFEVGRRKLDYRADLTTFEEIFATVKVGISRDSRVNLQEGRWGNLEKKTEVELSSFILNSKATRKAR